MRACHGRGAGLRAAGTGLVKKKRPPIPGVADALPRSAQPGQRRGVQRVGQQQGHIEPLPPHAADQGQAAVFLLAPDLGSKAICSSSQSLPSSSSAKCGRRMPTIRADGPKCRRTARSVGVAMTKSPTQLGRKIARFMAGRY